MTRLTRAYKCDACGKPSSRLHGLAAQVELPDELTTFKVDVRAYCGAHREDVLRKWDEEMSESGTLLWSASDAPVPLRPQDADNFVEYAYAHMAPDISVGNVDGSGGATCPHCQGHVRLDAGPHVQEARTLGGSAWQCEECGAAGVLRALS